MSLRIQICKAVFYCIHLPSAFSLNACLLHVLLFKTFVVESCVCVCFVDQMSLTIALIAPCSVFKDSFSSRVSVTIYLDHSVLLQEDFWYVKLQVQIVLSVALRICTLMH
jgi:hypothetical protein